MGDDRKPATAIEALKESFRAVIRITDAFPPLKTVATGFVEIIDRHDIDVSFLSSNFVNAYIVRQEVKDPSSSI